MDIPIYLIIDIGEFVGSERFNMTCIDEGEVSLKVLAAKEDKSLPSCHLYLT
jgi:hypothetical protein